MMRIGRVWRLGDDVRATDLLSPAHDRAASAGRADECAPHVLETIRSDFQADRRAGDLIVAGRNLGAGHAHYHRGAIIGARAAGIAALLAESLNGLFLRAAIDEGVVAWAIPGIHAIVADGDRLQIDLAAGSACNLTSGAALRFAPPERIVLDILTAGSTIAWALARAKTTA